MDKLAGLLKGLPLALCLATSIISRYRYTVREYLELWKSRSDASEILGTDKTLYRSMELSFEELENSDPTAAKILTLFSFLHHRDLWYDLCHNASGEAYPLWLQDLAREKKPFRQYCPLLADLSFIELRMSTNGRRMWETHPAVQVVARQRAKASEQEYIRCAISLVASEVPRSYEANSWETMRRLRPHVELCWSYVKERKWGSNTNLTDLDGLGRVFRHVGQYGEASLIYRMIERGLSLQTDTLDNTEFLANVLTNLGLVYTRQRKFDQALSAFDSSWSLLDKLDILTPNASMSIMYNKAVVFMMTGRLNEAEALLRDAAAHFSEHTPDGHILMRNERKDLYFRILIDLGEVSLRKGSVAAAMKIFHHVYDSQKKRDGEPHPTFFSLKLNMGRALTKLGRFGEAQALLLEVIKVYTEWWGRNHMETIKAVDELAWSFMEEGKEKQAANGIGELEMKNAEDLWNEVLSFYRSTDGDGSEEVVRIEANLQYLYTLRQPLWDVENRR
jgi:tetratricopeptide (TPR) repeat protein